MSTSHTQVDGPLEPVSLPALYPEEQGYDAPFASFTWEQWQQMQAHMLQRFTRFQRAIHGQQANVAVTIAQEVIQLGMQWLDEAASWIENHP